MLNKYFLAIVTWELEKSAETILQDSSADRFSRYMQQLLSSIVVNLYQNTLLNDAKNYLYACVSNVADKNTHK